MTTLDQVMTGQVPSASIPSTYYGRGPAPAPLAQQGSNAGLPGVNMIQTSAGPSVAGSGVAAAQDAGQAASMRMPFGQPVMWLVVLMALSIIMFAHMANVEIKG